MNKYQRIEKRIKKEEKEIDTLISEKISEFDRCAQQQFDYY